MRKTIDRLGAADRGAVALIDWNTRGHHESYLQAYAGQLLAQGWRVVVACVRPETLSDLGRDFPNRVVVVAIPGLTWIKARRWLTRALAGRWFARRVASIVKRAERKLGEPCGKIVLACLYESQAYLARAVLDRLGRPGIGLYLQAGVFHAGGGDARGRRAPEVLRLLRHPNLRYILMLDEGMAAAVERASDKPVIVVPDLADASSPVDGGILAHLGLPSRGARPPVVGLLGHLRPTKGVVELARIAVEHPELDVLFLFAGEFAEESFSAEECGWIERARALRGRVFFYGERIPDEAVYNGLVMACDIVWAVYPNVPHSSNTLSKAALFEKPVLVAEGHLMARRVREHGLGRIADGRDRDVMVREIALIVDDITNGALARQAKWAAYRELHSERRLGLLLTQGLDGA